MRITRLVRSPRTNRINIFIDGDYRLSVAESVLVKESLFVGKEMDATSVDNLIFNGTIQTLYDWSLTLIARRPRSESEINDKLIQKIKKVYQGKYKDRLDIVDDVIGKLKQKGYLDDEEFCDWWIQNRLDFKKKSSRELKQELLKKGVALDVIEKGLRKLVSSEDELSILRRAIAKKSKYYKMKTSSDEEYRDKMMKYLLRRGFVYDQIKQIL